MAADHAPSPTDPPHASGPAVPRRTFRSRQVTRAALILLVAGVAIAALAGQLHGSTDRVPQPATRATPGPVTTPPPRP